MRILCCLDGTNSQQLSKAVSTLLATTNRTIGALHVTDSGPEEHMERHRERFLRPPHPPRPRSEQMRQAEAIAAQQILEEGSRALDGAETIQRTGRPEQIIVQTAVEWRADLIIICSRSSEAGPAHGPKSVGHTARFVLDHAPCPVLLIRPIS